MIRIMCSATSNERLTNVVLRKSSRIGVEKMIDVIRRCGLRCLVTLNEKVRGRLGQIEYCHGSGW
jgi:hypothetical protein